MLNYQGNHQNLGVGFIKTIGIRGVGFFRQQVTWCWASSSNQLSKVTRVFIENSCQRRWNPMTDPWCLHYMYIYIYTHTNIWGILMGSMLPYLYIYIYIEQHHGIYGNDDFMIRPWMTFYLLETSEGNQLPVLVRWGSFAPILHLTLVSMTHHWRWWGPVLP